ncbi:hypothetical protein HMI56_004397, partial [Coelomomyces lativittatus]
MVRLKHRYLVFQIHSETPFTFTEESNSPPETLKHWIRKEIKLNFGILGLGLVQSSLTVPYYSPVTGIAILRSSRDHASMVWHTLTLITELNNHPCKITCIHCSGTIKKTIQAAIKYDQQQIKLLKRKVQEE